MEGFVVNRRDSYWRQRITDNENQWWMTQDVKVWIADG